MPSQKRQARSDTPARKPGRRKKGLVKVLVSLRPEQADLLRLSAYALAAFENRPSDYSELLRDILDKSAEFTRITGAVTAAMAAINATPAATERLAQASATPSEPLRVDGLRSGAAAATLREALMIALRPDNKVTERLSDEDSHEFMQLLLLLDERARERREAEKARVLAESGPGPAPRRKSARGKA